MLTIDWLTKVIFIPKSYTQFVSNILFEIRQLDIDQFRLDLKTIEADNFGIVNERTHTHNTTIDVGGVTLARVINIVNGYTITFEDGPYAVNLNGANSNIADVTNLNQVQIRSANSAGLTFSQEIQDQSFLAGEIAINTDLGLSGTQYPRGTATDPSDNWDDGTTIATNRKLNGFLLDGYIDLSASTSDMERVNVRGHSSATADIILDGKSTSASTFTLVSISGPFNGRVSLERCKIGSVTNLDAILGGCSFVGPIVLDSGSTEQAYFKDCTSGVPGLGKPNLDCNGFGSGIGIRNYTGGLNVTNYTHTGGTMTIDCSSASILLDSSCTEGDIIVRGVGDLTDNSGPNCNVSNRLLESSQLSGATGLSGATITDIANIVWDTLSAGNVDAGTFGKIMADLLTKANEEQHILNVHTEMLKE